MSDEQTVENSGEAATPENETTARIKELVEQRNEMAKLLDRQGKLMESMASNQQQAQPVVQQQQAPALTEEQQQWAKLLEPILTPVIAARDRAIMMLADRNDYVETMLEYPVFADPEIREKVEALQKKRGPGISRKDALIYLAGLGEVDLSKGKESKKPSREQQGANPNNRPTGVYTETGPTLGSPRNQEPLPSLEEFNSWPVEKMEEFLKKQGPIPL